MNYWIKIRHLVSDKTPTFAKSEIILLKSAIFPDKYINLSKNYRIFIP